MNALIEKIYATGLVQDKEGNWVKCFPGAISKESAQILYDFVKRTNPKRTIETGLGFGVSALIISQALQENGGGLHTAIDPHQHGLRFKGIGVLNIERAGFNQTFRFYPAFAYQILPQLLQAGERFDFAFIDGSHLFDHVIADFLYIDKMLNVDKYVAFDDLWLPGVRRAVNFILRNRAYELVPISSRAAPKWWLHAARAARRFLQDPVGRDWPLLADPYNTCILRKLRDDQRIWSDYAPF